LKGTGGGAPLPIAANETVAAADDDEDDDAEEEEEEESAGVVICGKSTGVRRRGADMVLAGSARAIGAAAAKG
jgi:hypothetical protein